MKHITSSDNPFYKSLVKLAGSARQRSISGQALLDGTHLLASCLSAGKTPVHVIVTEPALNDAEIQSLLAKIPSVPLTLLDQSLFAKLSELKSLSGILTLIELPRAGIDAAQSRFCLLLEDIQDPGNLGSMLRSAAAAGCDAVYLSRGCADAWSPRVLRAAMGGHFALSIQEQADLSAVVAAFPGTCYAAALQASSSLFQAALQGRVAFAIGNEGAGLSATLLGACSTISIPMPGQVESLNAAAAAAICLFEAVRQNAGVPRN
ncbi:MAG TPA: RNA methyltransferase [Gallionellaceae bacterium]